MGHDNQPLFGLGQLSEKQHTTFGLGPTPTPVEAVVLRADQKDRGAGSFLVLEQAWKSLYRQELLILLDSPPPPPRF